MTSSTLSPAVERPSHVPADLVFDFDMYADPRIHDDVQQAHAEVLKDAPDVFYTPRNGGHWVVRRYAQMEVLLKDHEHFSTRELHIPRLPDHPVFLPLSLDPPHSAPFRLALMPAFSPKAIRELEPKIREWAVRLIDQVAGAGECDFVEDIASLFPVSVFMEVMGMPLDRLREFRELAVGFFRAYDQEAVDRHRGRILAFFAELIELRRREPGDDLVSRLLAADIGGRGPDPSEMLAMCLLLFIGGMDTVTNVSGFTFRALAADPELQARLSQDPGLIPKFVEESLRCFGVVSPSRLVVRDNALLGPAMRAGDMVLALSSEAGRDPDRNADPRRFDLERKNPAYLTFGTGAHLCIGHILARAEMRVLTEEWLRRIPAFRQAPRDGLPFKIGIVAGLEALPLAWG
jgi:cytochrome P450